MYSEILTTIITKQDLELMLTEIDKLESSLYGSGKKSFDEVMKSSVRYSTYLAFSEYISKNPSVDKKNMLIEIKKELSELTEVELTLAFEPSQEILSEVISWLRQNVSKSYLNLKINPDIVAGAVVVYKGKYKDYSLAKPVSEYLQNEKNDILKILKQ